MRCLCAVFLFACSSSGVTKQQKSPATPPAPNVTIQNPNAAAGPPGVPAGADLTQLAGVQQQVDTNNAADAADTQGFSSNGWHLVTAVQPDVALVGFDPTLIVQGRESDLRMQLATTTPKVQDIANIVTVATQSQNADVRTQAVEALGRSNASEAQAALANLVTQLQPGEVARERALGALHPTSLADPATQQVIGLIDDNRLSDAEQTQVAFTLALMQMREQTPIANLSVNAVTRITAMNNLITKGAP